MAKPPEKKEAPPEFSQLSADQLDRLLFVIDRKSWIPLTGLSMGLVLLFLWSLFGQIPITITGQGILIYPRQVAKFKAPASGRLVELNVEVGDRIKKGQVLATLHMPDLESELQQEQLHLEELEKRQQSLTPLRTQRSDLKLSFIKKKSQLLKERLVKVQALAAKIKSHNAQSIQKQRQNLIESKEISLELSQSLKERNEAVKRLKDQKLVSEEDVVAAHTEYVTNLTRIADTDIQLQSLELKEIEGEQFYLEQLTIMSDLESQIQDLKIQESQLQEDTLQEESKLVEEIILVKGNISKLSALLNSNGQIVSQKDGLLLELHINQGQFIQEGSIVGAIETRNTDVPFISLAYFVVKDGKKIQPGMEIQITPDTVQRQRYGSIKGQVMNISPFPVTSDGAANTVGNKIIAERLTANGRQIEVQSSLFKDKDTPSGYQWTSSTGPDLEISPGTTTSVRVIVEKRAPITFIIPFLRSWRGS